jgi:hypothetical protein
MSGDTQYWLTKGGDLAPANPANTALGLQVASLETRFDDQYLTAFTAVNTAVTLTTVQFLNNIQQSTPAAPIVFTTPSAAALTLADGNAVVGRGFRFYVVNSSGVTGATVTLTGGAGATIVGNNVVAIGTSAGFWVSYTNVSNTPAYIIYRLSA